MSEFDEWQRTPVTTPDGANLPIDAALEYPVEIDIGERTPVPAAAVDACWRCDVRSVVRIRDDVPPPNCERAARRYADIGSCISTQRGDWALCAAKTILRVGDFEWYFGPERRTAARSDPPAGTPERRAVQPLERK